MSAPSVTPPQHDGRLVPAAVLVWLSTYAGLGWSAAGCWWAAGALLPVAVLCLRSDRRWALPVLLAVGCSAAALLALGLRIAHRDASPLSALAREHASAEAELTVREDPRPLTGPTTGAPRVLVPARADRLTADGLSWTLSDRVVVLADAEGWSGLLPSQRVRVRAVLGVPLGGDLTAAVLLTHGPPAAVGRPSGVQRAAGSLRAGLRDASQGLPGGADGLLPGLVVGDTSGMDAVLVQDFRTVGLSHLTAVSGANLTLAVGAVLLLLRVLAAGPRLSAAVGLAALVGFTVLARPSPSVLRAAAMGAVTLVALAAGRQRIALPALAGSVLALLFWQPELGRSAGFLLSALATAALVLVAPGWAEALRARGVPRGLAEGLALSAAAFVGTAPVLAGIGGQVSLVSVPANLLAEPAVAPATVLGLLAALLSPLSAGLAHALAWLAGLPAGWIIAVAEHASGVPDAVLPWPGGWTGAGLLAGALAVTALLVRYRPARRIGLAAGLGAAVVWVPVAAARPSWPPPGWLFAACDVGQGDALAVHLDGDAALVVDAGPDPVAVDGCLHRLGVHRIPLLLLTHLHADHVDGLPGVLHGRQVGAIAVGPLHEPDWAWRLVGDDAGQDHIPVRPVAVGQVSEVAGVRIEVVGPDAAFHGTRSDPNNSSVVLRITSRGHTLLLTGDVEIEAQRALLRDHPGQLTAEVLKVPHHGSAYSDGDFLTAVHASVGVISVGRDNDYGHPSALLLNELAKLHVQAFRTDQDGDVAIADRGGRLQVYARSRGSP